MFHVQYANGAGFDSRLYSFGVAVVMRHTFDGTGLILLCSWLRFRVWVWCH